MATVRTPVAGFTGVSAGVAFTDGVGHTTDASALAYFRQAGYSIDGSSTSSATPEPADPRHVGPIDDEVVTELDASDPSAAVARDVVARTSGIERVGTPLRDAAVDPSPSDFLPPTNAGHANPHGPLVVAPGAHAVPPAPIVPGPVSNDPAVQEAVETAAAEEALVAPVAPAPAALTRPGKGGSKADWIAYAIQSGADPDEAAASTRDALAATYGGDD